MAVPGRAAPATGPVSPSQRPRRPLGYSTGALAGADAAGALELLDRVRRGEQGSRGGASGPELRAVELSALRWGELAPLLDRVERWVSSADPALEAFPYRSFHAPSRFPRSREEALVEALAERLPEAWPVVAHPDVLGEDLTPWARLGRRLVLENMDRRKATGRTADELEPFFEGLPEAGLCLDLAHARQVDPSLGELERLLGRYGDRLVQVHLSTVDGRGRHGRLTEGAIEDYRRIAGAIPAPVPILLESPLGSPAGRGDGGEDGEAEALVLAELESAERALPVASQVLVRG